MMMVAVENPKRKRCADPQIGQNELQTITGLNYWDYKSEAIVLEI